MRYIPDDKNRKIKTTRISRLIIQRRRDDSIRKIHVVECRDTYWFPITRTFDDTTTQPRKLAQ